MTHRLRLSIITVTRNAFQDLKKTYESLIQQTYGDWEWLIIDGASSDETVEYIRGLKSSKIQIHSEADSGIYNAMNKGILKAQGEYFYFLNAGDVLAAPDSLERVLSKITGRGVFYSNIILDDSVSLCLRIYPSAMTTEYWLYNYLCHQAVIFHSDIFKVHGSMNEKYKFAADFEYFMRIRKGKKFNFVHINETLSVYDLHGVSASPKNREKVLKEFSEIVLKYFGFFTRCYLLSPREVPEIKYFRPLTLVYVGLKVLRKIRVYFGKLGREPIDLIYLKAKAVPKPLLRVLHLSSYIDSGGASVAAMRLHRALPSIGVETAMVVSHRDSHLPVASALAIKGGFRYKLFKAFDFLEKVLLYFGRIPKRGHLSINWNSFCELNQLDRILEAFRPDVVHLHWLGHGFLRIEDLGNLKGRLAWTFHDMWAFLSLDHLVEDPASADPITEASQLKRGLWNIDSWVWRRKKRAYKKIQGRVRGICPSNWMKEISDRSELMNGIPRAVISNSVDIKDFWPLNKNEARRSLGLKEDATVLLFGAFGPFVEENKGFNDFVEVVKKYRDKDLQRDLVVITFGSGLGYRTIPGIYHRHFESIKSNEFLRIIYSAADVAVVASRVESFCLVAAEAMACGTPVVSYDTSGLKDVVDHEVTGYRAKCFDVSDLLFGLEWVLGNPMTYEKLQVSGIEKIRSMSSGEVVAKKHLELYQNISSSK